MPTGLRTGRASRPRRRAAAPGRHPEAPPAQASVASGTGREMKWWGWGDPGRAHHLPEPALDLLRRRLGVEGAPRAAVALEDVVLAEPKLPARVRDRLAATVGEAGVRQDRLARVTHGAGKSYPDLVRQRAGDCRQAPDAVVFPRSSEEVAAVLAHCERGAVGVVPFGGGTSVVGGVEPVRDGVGSVISLDLGRLDEVVAIDQRSLTAFLEPGLRGPELEAALRPRGLTLGHFPQSFEYASVGGYVATRSAGQASTGYGRIDELVRGLRCVTPSGDLELAALPASAAGPQLRELVVGSEGTLGVITQVALQVSPAPRERRYEGWSFASFAEGVEAFRTLEQQEAAPDVARLSDEPETALTLALAGQEGGKARLGRLYLRARRHGGGCLAITGWEGEPDEVERRRARGARVLRAGGALSLGAAPGRAWERGRFAAPYLRDDLLARGIMVETLETAAQWSDLGRVYAAVHGALTEALGAQGTPPLVGCHVSHLYPTGASLYFTFIAPQVTGAELAQWRAAKTAAGRAITANGATITHHHAVGRDHAAWMPSEIGARGVAALRALKSELDPAGIMNPGKLLPSS